MSRYCELFAGGSENGFEIRNIECYKKWRETLPDSLTELLHEEFKDDTLYVYVGIRWKEESLCELDTFVNHGHPEDNEYDDGGNILQLWSGLSLFTKEPIELFQTDEEFPYPTSVFGGNSVGGVMYRVYAKSGEVIIQDLDFKILEERKYSKEELIEEDDLKYIEEEEQKLCDKCHSLIGHFNFENRGYFKEINEKYNYKKLCEKCYKELKKPFVEIRKLELEIQNKQEKLKKLRDGVSDN